MGIQTTIPDAITPGSQTFQVERVSVASNGTQGNGPSSAPAISTVDRYVTYQSDASNLVPGDTNGRADIFVFDRHPQVGTTERVSVASDGTEGNGRSSSPDISGNGRYVTYESLASNLVPEDTNRASDVFVFDRHTHTTERVSVASDGTQGNRGSSDPAISANGRYVTYQSAASNLVPGDTNGVEDIFVFDRQTGTTTRVSVASDGTQGNRGSSDPDISANGRYITYESRASNLVPNDTNNATDIFVFDRQTGTTERVSIASDGFEGNGRSSSSAISGNGRYVTYTSLASDLVPEDTNNAEDVFVFDRQTGTTERVSVASDGTQANSFSLFPAISTVGRYVTYQSFASNLVAGDTNGFYDVFVFDRQTGTTERVSVASDGTQANGQSFTPAISGNGRHVVYDSFASNLVPDDTNGTLHVFVVQTHPTPDWLV